MALTTRTITGNIGDIANTATAINDVEVTFTLVDTMFRPVDAWDAVTLERVSGTWSGRTNASGYFQIPLWPTSRSDRTVYYLCTIHAFGYTPIIAPLPYDTGSINLVEWEAQGQPVTAANPPIFMSYASNKLDVNVLTAVTNIIDSLDTTIFSVVEWIVEIKDDVTLNSIITKFMVMDNNGISEYTEYATIGDFTNYPITIVEASSVITLSVTNNGANAITVTALRMPILR